VNATGMLVAMSSLHLLNSSQLWGYRYSNLKWMTRRKRRAQKALPWSEDTKGKTATIWACQQVYPEVSQGSMLQAD